VAIDASSDDPENLCTVHVQVTVCDPLAVAATTKLWQTGKVCCVQISMGSKTAHHDAETHYKHNIATVGHCPAGATGMLEPQTHCVEHHHA
jgi:hypothetical protein